MRAEEGDDGLQYRAQRTAGMACGFIEAGRYDEGAKSQRGSRQESAGGMVIHRMICVLCPIYGYSARGRSAPCSPKLHPIVAIDSDCPGTAREARYDHGLVFNNLASLDFRVHGGVCGPGQSPGGILP